MCKPNRPDENGAITGLSQGTPRAGESVPLTTLRCFSQSELDCCSHIMLPMKLWPTGTQLTHPKHGIGKLAFRDDEGRMIFEFKPTATGLVVTLEDTL